jgi:anti-anti-sigma factor
MPLGNTEADALLVGKDERGYHLQALGSIRAPLCYPLRESLLSRLEESSGIPAIFVDLSRCSYMDSTFIGLLVAMDKRLQKGSGGRLHILAPSGECLDLLRQIGLVEYLLVEDQPAVLPEGMTAVSPEGLKPGAEFVLRAHEALMETSEEARRKFGLLKEMLERKLKAEKTPRDKT